MHFCKNCRNICSLYDDISTKKLYNICMPCNYKEEVDNMNIYSKSFNIIYEDNKISKILHCDPTLPSNNVRTCGKCKGNEILFIRKPDLSLIYICKNCNVII
jgi:DNA-directed RNA polymerase subunit M/transcription elongation factor TFIIS